MPTHLPQHHHPGRDHPPAAVRPSVLRMSLPERLGLAAVLITFLWAAVLWAMKGG